MNAPLTPAPRPKPDSEEQVKKKQQVSAELNAEMEAYEAARPPNYIPEHTETELAQLNAEMEDYQQLNQTRGTKD